MRCRHSLILELSHGNFRPQNVDQQQLIAVQPLCGLYGDGANLDE